MEKLNLYWGDFHKHLEDIGNGDKIIEFAKYHLDVYVVLCYPFTWETVKGARIESVRQRPEFLVLWKNLKDLSSRHNKKGSFVTFLGYEWHGNRTLYGDHNVIYYNEDNPLDDTWELPQLYNKLRARKSYAIPHHTAYMKANRGKNWDVWDPSLSPVMEVYSSHGSSEGVGTPLDLNNNQSMGPLTSGGTLIDALNRGYMIGVIASNDGQGLPGSWGRGVAGIWAEELSRSSIWKALKERRTFAVTGDRISLWFEINGTPMGSVIEENDSLEAKVELKCAQPLSRVELIHNGRVKAEYSHRWEIEDEGLFKVLVEFGWGPSIHYGFKDAIQDWIGKVRIQNGEFVSVQPRFYGFWHRYKLVNQHLCEFQLTTSRDGDPGFHQGLIFELRGNKKTSLAIQIDNYRFKVNLSESLTRIHLFPLLDESKERIKQAFDLKPEEIDNPDIYFLNSRKIRVHPFYPKKSYTKEITFSGLPQEKGNNYYYVRVRQIDGQMAWSSPIWTRD